MNRASSLLRASLLGQAQRRNKAYLGVLKDTLNDLPQPGGSWQTLADARQRKYTAHLVIGIAFLTFTIGFAKATGLFYFNATPPDRPADKNDYRNK